MRTEAELPDRPGQRLHRASPLFEAVSVLRQAAAALLGALLAGSAADHEWYVVEFVVVGAVLMLGYAVVRSLTTRYWLEADQLVLLQGLFQRRVRHLPFARIQNAVLRQNVVHRLFGVCTLKLESGGTRQGDADLRVLDLAAARAIEAALRPAAVPPPAPAAGSTAPVPDAPGSAPAPLLQLSTGEVLRAGLVLDRGFALVAAGLVGLFQFDLPGFDPGRLARDFGRWLLQVFGGHGALPIGLAILAFILLAEAVSLLLSMLQALLRWHGFTLERDGARLQVEAGLLNRARASATPDRVQVLSIYDGLWLRLLNRRALGLEVVGSGTGGGLDAERTLDWLAPIAPAAATARLAAHALPGLDLAALRWQPLHPGTRRRLARRSALLWLGVGLAMALKWPLLAPLVLLPGALGQLRARAWARYAGWALDPERGFLAWRSGVTARLTWIVPIARLDAIVLQQSPFDRRHGTAGLRFDTQAPQHKHALRMSFLGLDEAQRIAAAVRAAIRAAP